MPRSSLLFLPVLLFPLSLLAAPETVKVDVLQTKLDHPWSLAFLPDNKGLLITLKDGQLKHWQAGKGLSDPIVGVPKVWASGQGGLLDVVLAPDFEQSRRIWLSFAEAGDDGKAGTAVGYGRLSDDLSRIEGFQVVFRQMPKLSTGNHFGGRLVFDGKGHLFIGLGENNQRPTAQDLDKLQGKVVRLTEDGKVPPDNPMATHGINYSGLKIPEAKGEHVEGTEKPLFVWKVSPAVSGMAFYNSDVFPQWKNKLFIGALKEKDVIVLSVKGNTVTEDGRILGDKDHRIRDVRVGPDGYLYVLTDETDGQLWKVSPSGS